MAAICQSLGFKSRQAFYKRKRRDERIALEEARVIELAKQVRIEQYRLGTGKLYDDIKPLLQKKISKWDETKSTTVSKRMT